MAQGAEILWRKSSYSGDRGGDCVELTWRTSSYSSDQGGDCVQVASTPFTHIAVRDSKNPAGPQLALHPTAFSEFLTWTQSR